MAARDGAGMNLNPHKARPMHAATKAWWYESQSRIEVYVAAADGTTVSCSIDRRWLKDWLRRSEPNSDAAVQDVAKRDDRINK